MVLQDEVPPEELMMKVPMSKLEDVDDLQEAVAVAECLVEAEDLGGQWLTQTALMMMLVDAVGLVVVQHRWWWLM